MAAHESSISRAIEHFRSVISDHDAYVFSKTTLEDIRQEALNVEKERADKVDQRTMRRIEPYIDTLQSYAALIEVFCQDETPMCFLWVGEVIESGAFNFY